MFFLFQSHLRLKLPSVDIVGIARLIQHILNLDVGEWKQKVVTNLNK